MVLLYLHVSYRHIIASLNTMILTTIPHYYWHPKTSCGSHTSAFALNNRANRACECRETNPPCQYLHDCHLWRAFQRHPDPNSTSVHGKSQGHISTHVYKCLTCTGVRPFLLVFIRCPASGEVVTGRFNGLCKSPLLWFPRLFMPLRGAVKDTGTWIGCVNYE